MGISCLTDTQSINQNVCTYIKATILGLASTFLIPFRIINIIDSNITHISHFSKYNMLGSWKRALNRNVRKVKMFLPPFLLLLVFFFFLLLGAGSWSNY